MNYNYNYDASYQTSTSPYSQNHQGWPHDGDPSQGDRHGYGHQHPRQVPQHQTNMYGQTQYSNSDQQYVSGNIGAQQPYLGYQQTSHTQPMFMIPQRSPVWSSTNPPASPSYPRHQQTFYPQCSPPLPPAQHSMQQSPNWQTFQHRQHQPGTSSGGRGQFSSSPAGLIPRSHVPTPPQPQTSKTKHVAEMDMRQPDRLQRPPSHLHVRTPSHLQQSTQSPQAMQPHTLSQAQVPQRQSSTNNSRPGSTTALGHSGTPTSQTSAKASAPPLDYQQLLLVMAEDYVAAAHDTGSLAAFHRRPEDLQQYHKLIATGLSCVEASLTQFSLSPQSEARLALQYCNLVFKETENHDEVDKWLSKSIPLCERNKLLDLKYSLQHLSARALFATKPRVAMKSLDTLIADAETYKHVPWIYALRFLRVSFSFQLGLSQQDLSSTVQNLKAISRLAADGDDGAVSLLSATYEALLHLSSTTLTCVEDAQRAIAAAKSLQFHPSAKELTQVWILLDCIEIICSLMDGSPAIAAQKAEQMAPFMDAMRENPTFNDRGLLRIALQGQSGSLTENTSGIFDKVNDIDHLVFRWMTQRDLWAFCFLLNAITAQARSAVDTKAEIYAREGLKILRENLSDASLGRNDILNASAPLSSCVQRLDWWHSLRWCLQIYMAFNQCGRAEWATAQASLSEAMTCPAFFSINAVSSRAQWETFLQATIMQGLGKTEYALSLWQTECLQLNKSTHKAHTALADICILAALNRMLITLEPSHPHYANTSALHDKVGPLISNHRNKSLQAAYELVLSVSDPDDKILDKKKHFHKCLGAARSINNAQLVSIALTLMCTMFFKNVVGDQAQKSVESARALANRSKSALWRSVAAGLQEETAARHGREFEVQDIIDERDVLIDGLPEDVKKHFVVQ